MTTNDATVTTREAVTILNRKRHRGQSGWYLTLSTDGSSETIFGDDRYEWLTPFEAVAIAEKYLTLEERGEPR